jgi:hypothetical protein
MGMNKVASNLEAAKRKENSVITLERKITNANMKVLILLKQ